MTGESFGERLRGLDVDDRAALVAAVYGARGWDVARDGPEVSVTPPNDDRPHHFSVRAEGEGVATRADGPPLGTDELREMLVYALDPADRTRLCRRFLDCDPEELRPVVEGPDASPASGPPSGTNRGDAGDRMATDDRTVADEGATADTGTATGTGLDDDGPTDHGEPRTGARRVDEGPTPAPDDGDPAGRGGWWSRRALLVGVAAALVLGGIAAAGPAFAPAGDAGGPDEVNATVEGTTAPPGAREAPSTRASFPPGVGREGITSAIDLADAHAETLSGESYRLHITHREYVDGDLRGIAHERVAVESSDRYRSEVEVLGTVEHDSPAVGDGDTYANGTVVFVRPLEGRDTPEDADYRRQTVWEPNRPNRYVDRTQRYVQWYLSVQESAVVGHTTHDGTTHYRVTMEGDSWSSVTNVTGEARVDERGLVHFIRREYTPTSDRSVQVVITVRITLGPVTVTRPAWVDEEKGEERTATASGQA